MRQLGWEAGGWRFSRKRIAGDLFPVTRLMPSVSGYEINQELDTATRNPCCFATPTAARRRVEKFDKPDEIAANRDMVPLWLLPTIALFFLICAFLVAKARRLSRRRVFWDGTAAGTAAIAITIPGICCYAFGVWDSAGTLARDSGAACFLAYPIVGAVALEVTSRRFGFPSGSVVGAFLLGIFALAVIAAWAILYLKGPRGGWSAVEVIVSTASVILTYSAATCFGWWCRSMRRANA